MSQYDVWPFGPLRNARLGDSLSFILLFDCVSVAGAADVRPVKWHSSDVHGDEGNPYKAHVKERTCKVGVGEAPLQNKSVYNCARSLNGLHTSPRARVRLICMSVVTRTQSDDSDFKPIYGNKCYFCCQKFERHICDILCLGYLYYRLFSVANFIVRN